MNSEELENIARDNEVFFLYLYPASTLTSDIDLVESASRALVGFAPIFKSSSLHLYTQFNFPVSSSYLLVFKDHNANLPVSSYNSTARATSTIADPSEDRRKNEADVIDWLHANKFATLAELTGNNFKVYMEDGPKRNPSYVVLSSFSKKRLGEAHFSVKKLELENIAKAWRQALRFTPKDTPTHFIWVDADMWGKYLSATYGMNALAQEPPVVIVNPSENQFFPVDGEKSPLSIDGRQIFAALEAIYDGKLKPQTSISLAERTAKWLFMYFGWIIVRTPAPFDLYRT